MIYPGRPQAVPTAFHLQGRSTGRIGLKQQHSPRARQTVIQLTTTAQVPGQWERCEPPFLCPSVQVAFMCLWGYRSYLASCRTGSARSGLGGPTGIGRVGFGLRTSDGGHGWGQRP